MNIDGQWYFFLIFFAFFDFAQIIIGFLVLFLGVVFLGGLVLYEHDNLNANDIIIGNVMGVFR